MFYFETHDFRACLVYALDDELIILGATDIRDENPDTVRCSDEEISYLFGVLEEVLPGSNAKADEIVFAYAGIRPLPWSGEGATGAISRDHALRSFEAEGARPFPVLTLVGGKWTTYRACAEQIADAVLSRLGKTRSRSTLDAVIGGGVQLPAGDAGRKDFATGVARAAKLDPAVGETLLRRYGTTSQEVAVAIASEGGKPLAGSGYLDSEIRWIIRNERATRLSDIVLRRTLIPFEGLATPDLLSAIAAVAAVELGWDEARTRTEIEAVRTHLATGTGCKACNSSGDRTVTAQGLFSDLDKVLGKTGHGGIARRQGVVAGLAPALLQFASEVARIHHAAEEFEVQHVTTGEKLPSLDLPGMDDAPACTHADDVLRELGLLGHSPLVHGRGPVRKRGA